MLKTIKYALLLGTLLTSCTLDPKCEWVDEFMAFENYALVEDLQQVDLVLYGRNEDSDINLYSEYVVRSDSAYDALTSVSRGDSCDYCNYPQIDFSQYTLVGFTTEIGCFAQNYLKVSTTTEGLRYALKTVDESQCSSIYCGNFSFNWVLVPKSLDTGNITFEYSIARYKCDC